MKFVLSVSAFLVLFIAAAMALLVALPCATHRLYVANLTDSDAEFHVSLGKVQVWSDIVPPRRRLAVPVVSDIRSSAWTVQASTRGVSPQRYLIENRYYSIGYPHETDIYVIVLNANGVEVFPMDHPVITAVESESLRHMVRFLMVFFNMLTCANDLNDPFRP